MSGLSGFFKWRGDEQHKRQNISTDLTDNKKNYNFDLGDYDRANLSNMKKNEKLLRANFFNKFNPSSGRTIEKKADKLSKTEFYSHNNQSHKNMETPEIRMHRNNFQGDVLGRLGTDITEEDNQFPSAFAERDFDKNYDKLTGIKKSKFQKDNHNLTKSEVLPVDANNDPEKWDSYDQSKEKPNNRMTIPTSPDDLGKKLGTKESRKSNVNFVGVEESPLKSAGSRKS